MVYDIEGKTSVLYCKTEGNINVSMEKPKEKKAFVDSKEGGIIKSFARQDIPGIWPMGIPLLVYPRKDHE